MNILLSANNYPTSDYPFQTVIGMLCRELLLRGHDVLVAPLSVLSYAKHCIKAVPYHYTEDVSTHRGTK